MAILDLEGRIRELGFRVTPQRQLILEAIEAAGEHSTVEEIFKRVKEKSSAISQATVYRTLELFSKHNLIYANEISGNKVYELASGEPDHHHLVCQKCWYDMKIDHGMVQEMLENIDQEYRFLVQSEHLVLLGLCGHCRPAVD
ncbi:MAG: transcriptional repressor [Anaerolineae bacterium]|nr:transcriptional repressor [Anaerolineae bacterium]